jgi:hypothetical protein
LTIGAGGTTKNHASRVVDFNPQLEKVLCEMHAHRAPDCSFVFPSPHRGAKDEGAKSLRESFKLVRKAVAGRVACG